MAELFRTGSGAASRPRYEDQIASRDNISERFDVDSGLFTERFLAHKQPENEAPYKVVLIPYPIWEWPETNPTAQERASNGISAVLRPQETQGLSDPTFYAIFLRWPSEGGVRNLLGMFIRSRPKGATQWRSQVDYRPFTEAINQYGPSNDDVKDLYAEELTPDSGDEYQVATRYTWTPDPSQEFLSEIIDTAELPRVQPILIAELVQNALFVTSQKSILHGNLFAYGTFGETDLIELAERQTIAFTSGESKNLGPQKYQALFAENAPQQKQEEQKTADTKGLMLKHSSSFFTYADDIDGIIVID